MPEQGHNPGVVDLKELNEIMDNDTDLIRECFGDFIQEWPGMYQEIKKAVFEKNSRNLQISSHKLKGSLRYLAAEPAANAAYELETAGKNNDMKNLNDKLKALEKQGQFLLKYLHHFNG